MKDSGTRLNYLYQRWFDRQATPEETEEFFALLEQQGPDVLWNNMMQPTWDKLFQAPVQDEIKALFSEAQQDGIADQILARFPKKEDQNEKYLQEPSHRINFLRNWRWVAASIILLISIGAYLWMDKLSHPALIIANSSEISPGKDGAILTLADGSQVSLDSIQNGVVAIQGGATAKVVNGILQYEGTGTEMVYNTMSTPKGRQFHLTLPDGTEVWLNSASSIRYPTIFMGKERRVEVTGEAYFEVAKNSKMPFRLNINNKAALEVLGTEFNVNSYDNEESINTTLLEGSVKVAVVNARSNVDTDARVLKPGQQAQVRTAQNTAPSISVSNDADVEKVMAWKKGIFNFNNTDFATAMRQLERWYDVEVVYEKGIPQDVELDGEITKGVTLNGLLRILRGIGVKCELEGRKLLIRE